MILTRSAHHRLSDRLRPWAAPIPARDARVVAVIGAGPAGLATAALLRRQGVRSIVYDSAGQPGGAWPSRYDSLRLNTVRWMSDLPGHRMPRSLGRWVGRDDITDYLRGYATHHRLEMVLGAAGSVDRVERDGDRWRLVLPESDRPVDGVVIATGHARVGVTPDWPGAGDFGGRLTHADAYQRPGEHDGRSVLVVGAGSSGGEICVDLATADVDVTWSVRTAPRVFPREVLGLPATPFGPAADALPDRALDRIAPWLERWIYGRRDYLPEPSTPMMELLQRCKEPLTADGIVSLIREGRVRVVDAVDDLTSTGARLVDGTLVDADDVIAATGYRTALEPLVGHLGVLDTDGRPTASIHEPTLGFVGFRIPFTGTLWAIEQDARAVAAAFADALRRG